MREKPFIPAWFDDSGLSLAEIRVFINLCRRADNQTGIAWPSYESIMETCGISRTTAWRVLKSLETMNLISKVGKPFAGSCRYRVLPIVPPKERMDASNSATTGTNEPVHSFPSGNSNRSPEETPIVSPEEREGYPKKVIQRRKSNRENSLEAIQFANWFKSSLPQDQQDGLTKNWLKNYCEAYDAMINLDKRTPEQIREICKWARTDLFWKQQIRTPGKLRERDKQGTKYFEVITERMKQPTNGHQKPTATVNTGGRTSTNTEEL